MLISSSARLGTFTFEPKLCLRTYQVSSVLVFCFCLGDAFECELLGISDKFKRGGKQSCLLLLLWSPTCSLCCLSVSKQAFCLLALCEKWISCCSSKPPWSRWYLQFLFYFRFEIVAWLRVLIDEAAEYILKSQCALDILIADAF